MTNSHRVLRYETLPFKKCYSPFIFIKCRVFLGFIIYGDCFLKGIALVTEPVHRSYAISTARRAYNPAAIELIVHNSVSVLPGTHLHLSQVKHMRVDCLSHRHKHRNNALTLGGNQSDISLKTCHNQGLNPHGRQRQ